MKKLFFFSIILLFMIITTGFAAPLIKADADKEEYKPGELVTVKIQVSNNPGFHGLFFNLNYDSRVFSFEGLNEGLLVSREAAEHKFRYAFDQAKNCVVGYTLKGIGASTMETGVLAEIYFRVIGPGTAGASCQFRFSEYGIKDGTGNDLAEAIWQNSKSLRILQENQGAFVLIREPYDKQVFYSDTVTVRAISTRNSRYTIRITNEENQVSSPALPAAGGIVDGHTLPIVYGFNTIRVRLFNAQNQKVAEHAVTILRAESDRYVKIASPKDHTLVNSDTVLVRVSSSYENVTVNNLKAEPLSEKDGNNSIYEKAIWLQRGFNQIEAKATGPNGEIYKDAITVYYLKDDSIFRFLFPGDGEVIKTNVPADLSVTGEISSRYKSEGVENRITLTIIYHPFNPTLYSRTIIENEGMEIREADVSQGETEAAYMFTTKNPITLTGLDSGKLEIKAYKNKEGTSWEDEITRFVYADNSRLHINVIQPHIYGSDTLSSYKAIEDFNGTLDNVFKNTELEDDGSFSLQKTDSRIRFPGELSRDPVQKVIECRDGSVLALVNDSLDMAMKIYKKVFGKKGWELFHVNKNLFGYDLAETDLGILIGVSNRFSSNNSGLYLLNGIGLINIIINEPLPHVQFIVNHNGKIYLYGNRYSHLYSFYIFSLEHVTSSDGVNRLKTGAVEKILFPTDYSIAQFDLNDDGTTAVIRTIDGKVTFYQNLDNRGFEDSKVNLSGKTGFALVKRGEYCTGSYIAYVLVRRDDPDAVCIMEDKVTHSLALNHMTLPDPQYPDQICAGIGFRGNNFTLLFKKTSGLYEMCQAQILFNTVFRKGYVPYTPDPPGMAINTRNMDLVMTGEDTIFLGAGYPGLNDEPKNPGLYELVKDLQYDGTIQFDYKNPDIEGLTGFSFEIKPVWLESEGILFGFAVKGINGNVKFVCEKLSIKDLLALKSDYFTVTHVYDTVLKKEIIHVDFIELEKESNLSFDITLTAAGDISPGISNLTVNKKVTVKLPRSEEDKLYMPVKGYVYDPTAEYIYIQEQKVQIERNGFFFYNYPLDAALKEVPVRIFCQNPAGEYASVDFIVVIFDSKNDLKQICFKDNNNQDITFSQGNNLPANTEIINVSGIYYGLIGATAGYETYVYEYDNESDEYLVPVNKGVFTTGVDPADEFNTVFGPFESGYQSGRFTDQKIRLTRGKQRLILYVENPGGHRTEFKLGNLYPDVTYNLSVNDQKISIMNPDVEDLPVDARYTVNSILVDKQIRLTAFEVDQAPSPVFRQEYTILGEVKSLEEIPELLIQSNDEEMVFANMTREIKVQVDKLNRFKVRFFITMPEECEEKNYALMFTPNKPYLEFMKTGLNIRVTKSFENTLIVPDFSPVAGSEWSPEEIAALKKDLRIIFHRYVPENTMVHLLVNYETTIAGRLAKENPGENEYMVIDDNGNEYFFTGAKAGWNRVEWRLSYYGGLTISSSRSHRPGMEDFTFELTGESNHVETIIDFPVDMDAYYDNKEKHLPPVKIIKDKNTWCRILLNDSVLLEDNGGQTSLETYLPVPGIKQGKNTLTVYSVDVSGNEKTIERNFLYDTEAPKVVITSYEYDKTYSYLVSFTVMVQEANISKVVLYHGDSIVSDIQCTIIVDYIGNDQYRVSFTGLENQYPSIVPASNKQVFARAFDHAGHSSKGEPSLAGLAVVQIPEIPHAIVPAEYWDSLYDGSLSYDEDQILPDPNYPFTGRLRIGNSSISVHDEQKNIDFTITRPSYITAGPNFGVDVGKILTINGGTGIGLTNGFAVKQGSIFNSFIPEPAIKPGNCFQFNHERESTSITFGFNIRIEEKNYCDYWYDSTMGSDYYRKGYRRVLTIYENDKNKLNISLAYKKNPINNKYYCHLVQEEEDTVTELCRYSCPLTEANWHMVLLGCDNPENKTLAICIDGNPEEWYDFRNLEDEIFPGILDAPNSGDIPAGEFDYYFGSKIDSEAGECSIALPFTIDCFISNEDLEYITFDFHMPSIQNPIPIESMRTYDFDSPSADQGIEFNRLRYRGDEEDYFAQEENSGYTAPESNGSLRASSLHKNYIKPEGDFTFIDADNPVLSNITVTPDQATRTITFMQNTTSSYPGRYFFGNTLGNHGLKKDRWYSISGNVVSIGNSCPEKPEPRLVLRINDHEEAYQLRVGEFTFIFENTRDTAPDSVVMYIETEKEVTLGRDLLFTEGDYRLPDEAFDGLYPSSASTKYLFGQKGTVRFWYKPFNAHEDGFIHYASCPFSSDYVNVFTEINPLGYAVFKAVINGKELKTDVPVKAMWQYIQLSYSAEEKLAYLYIDGKIAGKLENQDFSPYGIKNTSQLTNDNVHFGSDRDGALYAEGFIDDVSLNHLCLDSQFEDKNPLSITYINNRNIPAQNPELKIQLNITADSITGISYTLDAKDGTFHQCTKPQTVDDHGFDIPALTSGTYILYAKMKINGHRYNQTYTFTKDDRPRFFLKDDFTSLIIKDTPTDIKFNVIYDDSYLLEPETSNYACLAAQLHYTNDQGEQVKTLFITQGYPNEDHGKWFVIDDMEVAVPVKLGVTGNEIPVIFPQVKSSTKIVCEMKTFYFDDVLDLKIIDFAGVMPWEKRIVNEASLIVTKVGGDQEYKLIIKADSESNGGDDSVINELSIVYRIELPCNEVLTGERKFGNSNVVELYYDDILKDPGYGKYPCTISLRYKGQACGSEQITLDWEEEHDGEISSGVEKRLFIDQFKLLYLERKPEPDHDIVKLYLAYDHKNINPPLYYDLTITSALTGGENVIPEKVLSPFDKFLVIDGIEVEEGESWIKVHVYSKDDAANTIELERFAELNIVNSIAAPRVVLTNTIESLIPYNNVIISWRGYYEGEYNELIEYSYNFDNQGWTAPNSQVRNIELYNLKEGMHEFAVRAIYLGESSAIEYARFFVDINRPAFDTSQIDIIKEYDKEGFLKSVTLHGKEKAITDSSLSALSVNGEFVPLEPNGSFTIEDLAIEKDGLNTFTLTAYDRVGNFSDHVITVNNPITELLFPRADGNVYYAPMTLTGRLNPAINAKVDIFLKDPLSPTTSGDDYMAWKKAIINEDRIFFVEDIFVNPGTTQRQAHSLLTLVIKTRYGTTYTRNIDIWAGNLLVPIVMNVSTHSVEGENADIPITITCKANVPSISSWSIDFDGDGIYDDILLVDNPDLAAGQTWTHVYSAIGLVKPRVRIITLDGNYFSVRDEIIIHEKITGASNKIIANPVSMDSVKLDSNAERIFVLAGSEGDYRIEIHEVGSTVEFISDREKSISLNGFGIDNPVKIALLDENHIFIASNRGGRGYVHLFKAGEYGNYLPVYDRVVTLNDEIKDIDAGFHGLYITPVMVNYIAYVPVRDSLPVPVEMTCIYPDIPNSVPMASNQNCALDMSGLLVTDYYNQRIIRFSPSLKFNELSGRFGNGEGEFLKPAAIASCENRIFVYDEGRMDIQVFSPEFALLTRIASDSEINDNAGINLDPSFFTGIASLSIMTREENSRLYYYAIILSKSSGKLSILRMPQWEEMRARLRNNRIVFLNDREVFSAKPSGSDLARLISSDSIPRIEGMVDYPALSPDGKRVVFTSRVKLYDGNNDDNQADPDPYDYDNLYMLDLSNRDDLQRIPLVELFNYEIERPVFNSNGEKLIFSARPSGGTWQIYIYDFETGGIQKLFSSMENTRFPYFSPDDRFVVYATDYDGDYEIEIVNLENTMKRIPVTRNNVRDFYPVWSTIYMYPEMEIPNKEYRIDSKISFVSERNTHKGIYYCYISHPIESKVLVVTKNGVQVGDNPDQAAIEITPNATEGDYPCNTGDGAALVYEFFDGNVYSLNRYDYRDKTVARIDLPEGARKPAGMKNTIANFRVVPVNGDQVRLTWASYTGNEEYYYIRYKPNRDDVEYTQEKVLALDTTIVEGLAMGVEYLFKVCLIENGEEVASTQWKKLLMPEVTARPTITISSTNPYRVDLFAWKPDVQTEWYFTWIIDNQEITTARQSQYFSYEFPTSGRKEILLKVENKDRSRTSISDPVQVDIVTDIKLVIEYRVIYGDTIYIELDSAQSRGNKIKSSEWRISGPGRQPTEPYTGRKVIIPLDGFRHKVNANLKLTREYMNNSTITDIIEKNIVVDLEYMDIKPLITYTIDGKKPGLFLFSGENSIGNINWSGAVWEIFGNGALIEKKTGASTMAHEFPENTKGINYSITLTVPNMTDGKTMTVSQVVYVQPASLEAVIDYEIITITEEGNVTGAKLLLSCANSRGSNIDFLQSRWNVPVAGTYGESPNQVGPTAIYTLMNVGSKTNIDVSLTLIRIGGTDQTTVTRTIMVNAEEIAETFLDVRTSMEKTSTGTAIVFSALSSTGPNIDWEKIAWQFNDKPLVYGPVAGYDVAESGEETIVKWVCTLPRYGDKPLVKTNTVLIKASGLKPVITVSGPKGDGNFFEMSVTDTQGINIDYENTTWYIYDGSENVIQKSGARIGHTFPLHEDRLGYPVYVEMFYKGSTKPFGGYTSIDVAGNELHPVITWDDAIPGFEGANNKNLIYFSAEGSVGSNIDHQQTRWTFGDNSQAQYGPTAVHEYPTDSSAREYTVSCTITRKSAYGITETETAYKKITIGSDEIKPVIKVLENSGGYFVLSAEDSEGRGLLLDRSVWLFEGEGDNESYNINQKVGKVWNYSYNESANFNFSETAGISETVGYSATSGNPTVATTTFSDSFLISNSITISGGIGINAQQSYTDYDGFKDNNESFSSSNIHTGAVVRKYIKSYDIATGRYSKDEPLFVTLFVYRASSTGGMEGRSITYKFTLSEVKEEKIYE